MPLFVAVSAKSALLIGAALGFTAAVFSNDRVIELAAETLQNGADRLNKHLKQKRNQMSSRVAFSEQSPYSDNEIYSEETTPGVSADEYDTSGDEAEMEFSDENGLRANTNGEKKQIEEILTRHTLD